MRANKTRTSDYPHLHLRRPPSLLTEINPTLSAGRFTHVLPFDFYVLLLDFWCQSVFVLMSAQLTFDVRSSKF